MEPVSQVPADFLSPGDNVEIQVAILAGGRGERLAEETGRLPKPLVEIGGRPILWHVLMQYAGFGCREFVIALGHRGDAIRRWFEENPLGAGLHVELVDTGEDTASGGRLKRLAPHLAPRTFALTWSDGLADVDLDALLAFHRSQGRLATLTAVHPPARFGRLLLEGDRVSEFQEKAVPENEWVNGAFFVLEPGVLERIDGDASVFETGALPALAREGQLAAFRHTGFWQCMDTIHERRLLDELWKSGRAPWKSWS